MTCRCGGKAAAICSRCKKPVCAWHFVLAIGQLATEPGKLTTRPVCHPGCENAFHAREWRPGAV